MVLQPLILIAHQPELSIAATVGKLESLGFRVVTCAGLEIEQSLRQHAPDMLVAVITSSEPVKDLVAQTFRTGSALPVPILVLSAHPDTVESYAVALEAGADNFLPFPPNDRQLHSVVVSLLRRGKYRREVVRDAEGRFSRIFENAAVGIAQLTPEGAWLRVNERLCQIVGYSREELLRTNFQEITHPDDLKADLDLLARLLRGDIPSYRMEKRYIHHAGHVIWITLSVGVERDENLRPKYLVSVVEEITDRKNAERERGIAEERLTAALNASATGTFRWDIKREQLIWDASLKKIFGFSPSHPIQRIDDFTNCIHPEDRERVFASLDKCRREGSDFDLEFRIVWPDGSVRWLSDRGRMFLDGDGNPDYMTGACLDITSRREATDELRASEERLRLALRSAKAGSFDFDLVQGLAKWSPELEELYGLRPGEFHGGVETWRALVHPADRERALTILEEGLASGELNAQWRIVRPNGEVRWVSGLGKVLYSADGKPSRLIGVNIDITEQRVAEQALREKAQIIDQIHDAVISADRNNCIVTWNGGAERLFGYTAAEACGQSVTLVHLPNDGLLQTALDKLATTGVFDGESKLRRKSGELFDAHMSIATVLDEDGNFTGTIGYITDVTERKRAEHVLRISEKLAATGRLASTLAHEINNPLASVTNLLYLLSQNPSLDEAALSQVSIAEAELSRVTHITRNLLSFHREDRRPENIDAADILDNILDLYQPKLRARHITVAREYRDRARVRVYAGELKQVISNLMENAIDAMPDHGEILVRVKALRSWRNGGVQISIADNGRGMERDDLERIFEPFFTTKGEKGTGLGLWVTKDIVNKQGGHVQVRSRKGLGTVFTVVLPMGQAAQAISVP